MAAPTMKISASSGGQFLNISHTLHLAAQHHQAGQLQQAEALYQQVLRAEPDNVKALYFSGGLAYQEGRYGTAVERVGRAIALDKNVPDFHRTLGLALQAMGRFDEAVESYRTALRLGTGNASLHNDLGAAQQALGKLEEAAESYREALRLNPEFAVAYNNLGTALQRQGKFDEAAASYRRALALKPDYVNAIINLGSVYQEEGRLPEAIPCFERALALKPSDGIRVKLATALPVIMGTKEEVLASRRKFEADIDRLLQENIALPDPLRETKGTSFYLTYHGMNDRELHLKLARLYEQACPSLLYVAPHCQAGRSPAEGRKIKIGFVSAHLRNHTIGRLTAGIIANLPRDSFSPRVFSPPRQTDELSRFIAQGADHAVTLSPVLEEARKQIAEHELDILFYPDIGMDFFTYFLAYSRLAPVQCVTWGHPVTTGIRNIDYFISGNDLEPEGAEAHYSEKLVRLNSLPTYYHKPTLPEPLKDRSHFGLEDGRHIYLCPQTLFKFHPDFDPMLADILRRDPAGQLVLIEGTLPHWTELLSQRFAQSMPDVMARIRFLPSQPTNDFLNLIAVSDVILDPFHFGGGNTAYEALAVGAPIVTWPGAYMRGRVTYACYRKMGVMNCVADSPDQYAELAVRLGCDRSFREEIRAKILASNSALYEDAGALRELEKFFVDALRENPANPKTNESDHA
jgi:predicted O-linked N-acetylglucosamine transferase (SPINDLY family)